MQAETIDGSKTIVEGIPLKQLPSILLGLTDIKFPTPKRLKITEKDTQQDYIQQLMKD